MNRWAPAPRRADVLASVVCAFVAQSCFRDHFGAKAFVDELMRDDPWSTRGATTIVMLVTATAGFVTSILLARRPRHSWWIRASQIASLAAMVGAWLVATEDFLSSAGRFG